MIGVVREAVLGWFDPVLRAVAHSRGRHHVSCRGRVECDPARGGWWLVVTIPEPWLLRRALPTVGLVAASALLAILGWRTPTG